MSRFLKRISNILILGCFACGCSIQTQRVPTDIPTMDLTPLTSGILISDEINSSGLVKVDEGLIVSDRNDCLPKDCAFSVWDILEQDSLDGSDPILQLAISLRSFRNPEDATSNAETTIRKYAGQPGILIVEIPKAILPEQSWAYAEDGRFVIIITVYGNIQIGISLSEQTWGINDPGKAAALLADLAKLQIDKLALLSKR